MNKKKYQTYINNFRRKLTPYLKSGIGLSSRVHPSEDGGAVVEFKFGQAAENDDEYDDETPSLGAALKTTNQHYFGGNIDGFRFKGTNTILERDRIIMIKESSQKEWDESAAFGDVEKLLSHWQRAPK